MCRIEDFKNMKLDPLHALYLREELNLWHSSYLSPKVKGGTILDIGAGNGETAQFYLNHGAERVICIEPDADLLYRNLGHDLRVIILPYAVNFIKSDCEGGEEDMMIEAHFPVRFRRPNRAIWIVGRETRPFFHWAKSGDGTRWHKAKITIAHAGRVYLDFVEKRLR